MRMGRRAEPRLLLRSGAFRLALMQAAVFAVISASLFGVTWWSVRQYIEQQIHAAARDELKELGNALAASGEAGLPARVEAFQHGADEYVGLFDPAGQRLAGDLEVLPEAEGDQGIRIHRRAGRIGPVVHAHVVRSRMGTGQWLVAGVNRREGDALLATVGRAFLGAGLLALVATLIGGFLTARRYLHRVATIADAAARIVEGRLETRLPVRDPPDEIDRLSVSLNAMWTRIEALLSGMRQISTDVAHELRTPLAHLRFRLERTRDGAGDAGVRAALDASLQDVDHVLAVFGALLRIAQIEARERQAGFETLDLSQLIEATTGDYRPLFEDEGRLLETDIEPGLALTGDRTLLVQLLVNLLENILRHTPPGTRASVGLRRSAAGIVLTVADAGPGIAADQRERVLRPLVRLDLARTGPGAGLGLALVKAISDLHEARLELADAAPGLCIRIHFAPRLLTNR
ncbi:MAG: HAMP domain-containing protein [Gammaproteobacteria bacterium]|nr:HAMP domain-containing protein [Gammaproteobacteria bacterium]